MAIVGFVGEETIHLMGQAVLSHFTARIENALTRAAKKATTYCSFDNMGSEAIANVKAKTLFPNRLLLLQAHYENPLATVNFYTPDQTTAIETFLTFADYIIVLRSHSQTTHDRIDSIMNSSKPILLLEYYKVDKWLNLE